MRGLMAAVIGMGILIVAGVTVIITTLIHRMSSAATPIATPASSAVPTGVMSATLDEPAGTRVTGTSVGTDRVAVTLGGAGPDRVVVVDTRTGQIIGRVSLAH